MKRPIIPARTAAEATAVGFVGMAGFQAALALGAPLGPAAWGGAHTVLPPELRIASGIAICVFLLGAAVVLKRAGLPIPRVGHRLARLGTWFLVVALFLSALGNFTSASGWERFLNGPLALALAALCLVVARSELAPARSG